MNVVNQIITIITIIIIVRKLFCILILLILITFILIVMTMTMTNNINNILNHFSLISELWLNHIVIVVSVLQLLVSCRQQSWNLHIGMILCKILA